METKAIDPATGHFVSLPPPPSVAVADLARQISLFDGSCARAPSLAHSLADSLTGTHPPARPSSSLSLSIALALAVMLASPYDSSEHTTPAVFPCADDRMLACLGDGDCVCVCIRKHAGW